MASETMTFQNCTVFGPDGRALTPDELVEWLASFGVRARIAGTVGPMPPHRFTAEEAARLYANQMVREFGYAKGSEVDRLRRALQEATDAR